MVQDGTIDLLRRIADAVETRLAGVSPTGYGEEVGMGADGTPTKHVDILAEEVILEEVENADLALNVLSEEAGFVDHGAEQVLVVDPIDGTTNAAHGLPAYCVSLAVGTERLDDVHTGLVRNLPTGQTYEAQTGQGAMLDGRPIKVQGFDRAWAMISSSVSREPTPETLTQALKRGDLNGFRHIGSAALEMSFIAHGALDVYYHPEPRLRVTDIAAGSLILREAGGHVLDPSGEELEMQLDLKERVALLAVGDLAALDTVEVLS